MPIPWQKVVRQRPHMLVAARGWYDKWIRGRSHDGADGTGSNELCAEGRNKVEAYGETVRIEDVVEVKETTKDVASRLEALEFAGMAQSETIRNLTDQNQTLSRNISDLQQELSDMDQHLKDVKINTLGHQSSMKNLEMRMQELSSEFSRLTARANMAIGVAMIGVVGSIAAISLFILR